MSIATELQNYNDGLLGAYNAVDTKGGTIPTNKNLTNLPTAIDSIPSGAGDVTNAIIDQFKATTSEIPANTFIEISDPSTISTTPASSYNNASISLCSVAIDANTVFSTGGTGSNLQARLFTINNSQITAGSLVTLTSGSNTAQNVSAFLVDTNTIAVFHKTATGTGLTGQVVTIQNGVITPGTEVGLYGTGANTASIEFISTNKVMGMGIWGSKLQSVIFSIENGSITAGQSAEIESSSSATQMYGASLTKIDSTHALLTYSDETDSNIIYGRVCEISGTTITVGARTTLANLDYPSVSVVRTVKLANNKILITVGNGTRMTNTGIIVTLDNFAIDNAKTIEFPFSNPLNLSFDGTYLRAVAGRYIHTCKIAGGKIYYLGNKYFGDGIPQSEATKKVVAEMEGGDLFMFTRSGSNGLAVLIHPGTFTATASKTAITGLAKTTLTTSTAGDVYLLPLGTI